MIVHTLKTLRLKKGLPIAAVAVRARVGTGTITMIERHGHDPRLETKEKIAAALGVSVEAIWPSPAATIHAGGLSDKDLEGVH